MDAQRIPFLEEDERRIGSAALWGMIVAICSIATALLTVVTEIGDVAKYISMLGPIAAGSIGYAVITIAINAWLLQASLAFRKVASSDQGDQGHLLTGFRWLRAYFMVQVILVLVVVLGVIVLAIMF